MPPKFYIVPLVETMSEHKSIQLQVEYIVIPRVCYWNYKLINVSAHPMSIYGNNIAILNNRNV